VLLFLTFISCFFFFFFELIGKSVSILGVES
jgi:hypothetical protein